MDKKKIRKYSVIAFIGVGLIAGLFRELSKVTVKGNGTGFNDDLIVTLTAYKEGGKYVFKTFDVEHTDTKEIAGPAIEFFKNEVVKKQNTNIDVFAGATYTSYGLQDALKDAMSKVNKK